MRISVRRYKLALLFLLLVLSGFMGFANRAHMALEATLHRSLDPFRRASVPPAKPSVSPAHHQQDNTKADTTDAEITEEAILEPLQSGGSYNITQSVVSGGGGESAGGSYAEIGTAGEGVVSSSSGGQYSVGGGFWGGGSSGGCLAITVSPAISTLPAGAAGQPYSQSFTATGGTAPYSFSISAGTLPNGLSLAAGGLLSGTPTAFGTFNFTVRATDNNGCTGERAYSLVINSSCGTIALNPAALANGFVSTPYNQTVTAGGGTAPYTFTTSTGALPGGVNLSSGGALLGTPTTIGIFNFTIQATDANGCAGTRSYTVSISSSGLMYYPLPHPIRLFDTRAPIAGFPACEYLSQPLVGGAELVKQARISCDGITIPADAQAIVGNATVINPSAGGYLTLWPDGQARPPVSNLNYVAGEIVPNAFTLGLSSGGQFRIFSVASTDFAMDITGYFAPPQPTGLYYHPLSHPIRLFDTRAPIAGFPACEYLSQPLVGGAELVKQARISCDGITIPADAQAIVGNATVIVASGNGYLTLWPDGQARPPVSNLNYVAGQIVANSFTVGLSSAGQFRIFSVSSTNFAMDIAGYYSPSATDANGVGLLYSPLQHPIRLFDTRAPIAGFPACEYLSQPLVGGAELVKQARITCDGLAIPAQAQAIVGNATVIVPAGSGYLTLWPDGQARPPVSNLNYVAGQIVPNAFTLGLSGGGQFRIFSVAGTNFAVDVAGFYAP